MTDFIEDFITSCTVLTRKDAKGTISTVHGEWPPHPPTFSLALEDEWTEDVCDVWLEEFDWKNHAFLIDKDRSVIGIVGLQDKEMEDKEMEEWRIWTPDLKSMKEMRGATIEKVSDICYQFTPE